jgi:hypothetical protein
LIPMKDENRMAHLCRAQTERPQSGAGGDWGL